MLLQGESGTGKELVAQSIHRLILRNSKIMLPLNCGSANENLINDELFGHERGGFTGANKLYRGYFECANGGTLFLDEITEMPIDLQAHLLRVLETNEFVRIGGDTLIKTNVSVITATNLDPHEAIALGKLREDLYYRLAVFPIYLPPLRERAQYIGLLAKHFVQQFNIINNTNKSIAPDTLEYLQTLAWPGNIRELKNAMQRAHLIAEQTIEPSDFDIYGKSFHARETRSELAQTGSSIEKVEQKMILDTH